MLRGKPADPVWLTASGCTAGNCVQAAVADSGATVLVRDSKNPDSVLSYSAQEWDDFLNGIRSGDFSTFPTA